MPRDFGSLYSKLKSISNNQEQSAKEEEKKNTANTKIVGRNGYLRKKVVAVRNNQKGGFIFDPSRIDIPPFSKDVKVCLREFKLDSSYNISTANKVKKSVKDFLEDDGGNNLSVDLSFSFEELWDYHDSEDTHCENIYQHMMLSLLLSLDSIEKNGLDGSLSEDDFIIDIVGCLAAFCEFIGKYDDVKFLDDTRYLCF